MIEDTKVMEIWVQVARAGGYVVVSGCLLSIEVQIHLPNYFRVSIYLIERILHTLTYLSN